MNDNINDFLDNMTQQELEIWEQIDLIDMKDELAKKRIQKMVKKKLKYKKDYKKSIVVAAVVCIMAVTAMTTEAVQAALERVFHFVPNIGIVESDTVYDVEILCGKLQKDNVTVELKDCYFKEHFLLGTIYITDTSPYDSDVKTEEDIIKQDDMMKEMQQKYSITLHHDQQQHILYFSRKGYHISQNERQLRNNLQVIVDKIVDKSDKNKYYEIEVTGFDEKLSFRLKKAKPISNLKQIGSTITQNGTSITATAEMTEQGAKIDYYAICSEEAQTITQFGEYSNFWNITPYFESIPNAIYECYLKTKSGDILYPIKKKSFKESGGEAIFDVTKKDFPATFYYTALSAKTDEYEFEYIPIPEVGQTIQTDISIPFQYGTVKVLSVSRKQEIDDTGVYKIDENGKYIPKKGLMDKVTVKINIEPNQKKRILYNVCTKIVEGAYYGSYGNVTQENDIFNKTITFTFFPEDLEQEQNIKLQFDEPTYWIGKEYAIPVKLK